MNAQRYDLVTITMGMDYTETLREAPNGEWVRFDDVTDVERDAKNAWIMLRRIIHRYDRAPDGLSSIIEAARDLCRRYDAGSPLRIPKNDLARSEPEGSDDSGSFGQPL